MKFKLYTSCEMCNGLFEDTAAYDVHSSLCDGSIDKSTAEKFAIPRSLFLSLSHLIPDLRRESLKDGLSAKSTDLYEKWRIACKSNTRKRNSGGILQSSGNKRTRLKTDSQEVYEFTAKSEAGTGNEFLEGITNIASNDTSCSGKDFGTVLCKNGIVRSARLACKRIVRAKQTSAPECDIPCDSVQDHIVNEEEDCTVAAKQCSIMVNALELHAIGEQFKPLACPSLMEPSGNETSGKLGSMLSVTESGIIRTGIDGHCSPDVDNNVDNKINDCSHDVDNNVNDDEDHINEDDRNEAANHQVSADDSDNCKTHRVGRRNSLGKFTTNRKNNKQDRRKSNVSTARGRIRIDAESDCKASEKKRKNVNQDSRPPGVGVKRSSGKYVGKKVEYDQYHEKWAELYSIYRVGRDRKGEGERSDKEVGVEVYACDRCEFRSSKLGFFDRHMRSHSNPQVTFICEVCSYKCDSIGKLNKHASQHRKPYLCEFCSLRFSDKQALQRHTWIHTKSFPFSCPDCDYRSRCRRVLEDHRRKHTGDILKCDVAGCDFTSCYKAALTRHVVVQHEAKVYKCDLCEFSHTDRYKYQRHVRQHSEGGATVYTCQSCSYTTPTKKNLTRHALIHATDKIYYCDRCPYSSMYSQSLRVHMMGHYGCKPWLCSSCGFSAVTRAKVHLHIRTKHPDLSNVKAVKQEMTLEFRSREFAREPTAAMLDSVTVQRTESTEQPLGSAANESVEEKDSNIESQSIVS